MERINKIPGFVDLQVNGFMGIDFSSPDLNEEKFIAACRMVHDAGTTAFLPTIVTSPEDVYRKNISLMAQIMDKPEFAGILPGIHIEGPFLSSESGASGAHNTDFIRNPDIAFLDDLIKWSRGKIKIFTVAADIDGAEIITRHAVRKGITVSLGHHMALEEDLTRSVKAGATVLTHLGNGLPNLLPRHVNPIWAGLANDDLTAMVIADGHHLPASILKSIIRVKGVSRTIVVSDQSYLAGMPPGKYTYNDEEVILEENGLLHNIKRKCMAGSTSTMLDCMNHLASLDFLTTEEMIQVGYHNPLRLIGVNPEAITSGTEIYYHEEKGIFSAYE